MPRADLHLTPEDPPVSEHLQAANEDFDIAAQVFAEPCCLDMTNEDYHAHPALSSTGARTLVKECPAVYQYERQHGRHSEAFDIGSAVHLLVLEPHLFDARVVACGPDFTTKDAKAKRAAAYADGLIPLRDGDMETVRNMRAALQADPMAAAAFTGGSAEQSLFWVDPEFGIPCRTRPDYLPQHTRYLIDLKTAATSHPAEFEKDAAKFGYYAQASWYLDGVEAVSGVRPERFAFVVVAKKPPHLVTVHWVTPEALQWGAIENRYARGVYAYCTATNNWPGYTQQVDQPARAFDLTIPGWKVRDMETRHSLGGYEPPPLPETYIQMEAAE
ncbi:MAG: PD-(D/E)XK nuclease-like domain-containing protein [Janthinobacterium lividum]